MIALSEILDSAEYRESDSLLTLAMGKGITGEPVVADLAKAPHRLVAGTTGAGKSVVVNALILSMLYQATPEDVRMIMSDPKMLELSVYEGIPHLLAPVVTDMKLAANALNWGVAERENRYRVMSDLRVRNLAGCNQKVREARAAGKPLFNPFPAHPEMPEHLDTWPMIVVIIDEPADLMMVAGKKIEELIARLAQKARAAGIHLILATQRPSVDVVTGLIKANIPTRVAFQVSSKIDSRTILDQRGAESLLGPGHMLFLPPGTGYPQRIHGAFVADEEVHHIVAWLKRFGEPDYKDKMLASPPVRRPTVSQAKTAAMPSWILCTTKRRRSYCARVERPSPPCSGSAASATTAPRVWSKRWKPQGSCRPWESTGSAKSSRPAPRTNEDPAPFSVGAAAAAMGRATRSGIADKSAPTTRRSVQKRPATAR